MSAVSTLHRRRGGERGVTIVEAAFALPILLMFMFGLVDLGMWVFNSNQATNAARDGARLGIIDFETADVSGSMHDAIVEAVEARLDRDVTADQVEVRCVRSDGTEIACSSAKEDTDRVEVNVEWHWDLVTPVAGIVGQDRGAARGSASMVISGRPLAPPSAIGGGEEEVPTETNCVATVTYITESVARKNNSSQLQHAVDVEFTTTGTCTDLRVELQSPSGDKVPQAVCGCESTPKVAGQYEYSYKGSDNIWTPSVSSSAYARIYDGATEVGSATFTVL